MCGVVAVLPDYDRDYGEVQAQELIDALPEVPAAGAPDTQAILGGLELTLKALASAVELYSSPVAWPALSSPDGTAGRVTERLAALERWISDVETGLDSGAANWDADLLEQAQGRVIRVRDLLWALRQDRVAAAARIRELADGATVTGRTSVAYLAIDSVLDSVDRLEVRGRDSAGIQVWISLSEDDVRRAPESLRQRQDPEYRSGGAEYVRGGIALVYKRASVIGALGDNVAYLRDQIRGDLALHELIALPSARVSVLAHTRWASVGRISEANAHPVNSADGGRSLPVYATAVLNGDIDNHVGLRAGHGLSSGAITTDAKLIPVMLAERIAAGDAPAVAMAACVRDFHGSMAIVTQDDAQDGEMILAVKGSGQGLYVGLARGCFIVASEVYGLVALTDRYIRVDGAGDGADAGAMLRLHRRDAGSLRAIERVNPDGSLSPVETDEVRTAEITTRDIARGPHEHYLAKEIGEAPSSFRKTFRGRVVADGERMRVALAESSLPQRVRQRFADGEIDDVIIIGQGTAAVASHGIATVLSGLLPASIQVRSMPASELSAWKISADMSRVCIVAISQSGTTTDTNRTVDMVRGRGAAILAIVNRRDSDLVHKSDGVLYTSDGRDIEMAVASTKAFYSQVAAGVLLGLQLASVTGALTPDTEETLLRALMDMPQHLETVLGMASEVAGAAAIAARHTSWAVVGSGPNRTAAEEIRIKLSELCYKTVSTDAVEDKKHVDLSAEAMVLVCAAGTPAGQLRDLSKEIEIFAAHKNVPIVIVDSDVDLPWATEHVLRVPRAHPLLAWLLSTAVGHLFAYHAAQAIDAAAVPLRRALTELEEQVDAGPVTLSNLHEVVEPLDEFVASASTGAVRGVLSSDAALGLAASSLLLHGLPGQLAMAPQGIVDPVEHVRDLLTAAIDELSRSIDSVKHQAKTVTVGTSRGDSDLLDNALTAAFGEAGGDLDMLGYASLLAVRAFARVTASVSGATRYAISWSGGRGMLRVTAKTGVARDLPSRADDGAELTGSKDLVVQSRLVRLVRGRRDGRLVLMIPEQAGARVSALTLLHLSFAERADAARLVELLEMTGSRLPEIRAAVTETDRLFHVEALSRVPVETLLLAPVEQVAQALNG